MSLKNPVTPPVIDPGTVRIVAQRLNHYATPGPNIFTSIPIISTITQRHYFMWHRYFTVEVSRDSSAELGGTRMRRESGFMHLVQCITVNKVLNFYYPYLRKRAENVSLRHAKNLQQHVVHCKSKFCTLDELTGCYQRGLSNKMMSLYNRAIQALKFYASPDIFNSTSLIFKFHNLNIWSYRSGINYTTPSLF
jgi:hypothetical protein